jgi:hypothetical protein
MTPPHQRTLTAFADSSHSPHLPSHDSKRYHTRHVRRNTKRALHIFSPNTPTDRKHDTQDQRNSKHDRHSQRTVQAFHEMETPACNRLNQIRPERQCLFLSLGNVTEVERGVKRLCGAGSKEVHHMRGTDRRTFLQRRRRQEIVFVESRREFIGENVIDQILGTKLELCVSLAPNHSAWNVGHTSTNSILFSLYRSLSLQLLLPKYALLKAWKKVASVNSFSCSSLHT